VDPPGAGSALTQPGNLGALITLRASDELKLHFQIALNNGLSLDEIEEVIYHMTAYAGYPAAVSARKLANEVLKR
jgi:4-carboxymuconolactone decarboxylase